MPDADSNRKRSRSPSDTEQHKNHKRPNTGTAAVDGSSSNNTGSGSHSDINMAETNTNGNRVTNDTNSSTPNSNRKDDHKVLLGVPSESRDGGKNSATTSGEPSSSTSAAAAQPAANIHMRCLIVTQDASIIIGKGGSHVNEIREKSGARVMVSESIPGNPERILNVSGPLDAVSKVGFPVLQLSYIFSKMLMSTSRRLVSLFVG